MSTNSKIRMVMPAIFQILLYITIQCEVHVIAENTSLSTEIDVLTEKLMKQLNIPGLALVIVKDGQVMKSDGYGYRNVEEKLPVTDETLYTIGSITKSMTAMMIVKHFGMQNLSLDYPLRKFLGNKTLSFSDNYRTNHLSMRDLLTHRTGIQVDGLNLVTEAISDRNDYVNRVRYFPENNPLRTTMEYNNDMYLVAGWVLEQITNKNWNQLVKEDILEPLNMTNSMIASEFADKYKTLNFAKSYFRNDSKSKDLIPIDMDTIRRIEPFNPAGGIVSSVKDMAKYIQCYLNNGAGVLDKTSIAEMYVSGNPLKQKLQLGADYLEFFYGYALGLIPGLVKDKDLLAHDGGWIRQSSAMRFYPQLNMGIFIAVQDPDQVAGAVLNAMLENGIFMLLTDGKYMPELFTYTDLFLSQILAGIKLKTPPAITADSLSSNIQVDLPFSEYVGTYGNLINGNLTVELSGNSILTATLGWLTGQLIQIANSTSKGIFELDYSNCSIFYDLSPLKIYAVFNHGLPVNATSSVQFSDLVVLNLFVKFERNLKLNVHS